MFFIRFLLFSFELLLFLASALLLGIGRTIVGSMRELPPSPPSPMAQAALSVAEALDASGIAMEIGFGSKVMGPVLWSKLAVNSVLNPLSALLGVRNGAMADLLQLREGESLGRQIVNEVATVAARNNSHPPPTGLFV